MDSSNVVDLSVLKTLPHTIQTSNHNERKTMFEELDNVLIYSKLLNETNEGMSTNDRPGQSIGSIDQTNQNDFNPNSLHPPRCLQGASAYHRPLQLEQIAHFGDRSDQKTIKKVPECLAAFGDRRSRLPNRTQAYRPVCFQKMFDATQMAVPDRARRPVRTERPAETASAQVSLDHRIHNQRDRLPAAPPDHETIPERLHSDPFPG